LDREEEGRSWKTKEIKDERNGAYVSRSLQRFTAVFMALSRLQLVDLPQSTLPIILVKISTDKV